MDGWGRMALVDCNKPRNKKTESWASYCMWPEHTVTYIPQLCVRKIKSSASSCKGPITLRICICKICKEKPLQNNCSSWNPFYLVVDLEGAAMDPAHCWIVVLIIYDLIYYLQIPPLKNIGLLHMEDLWRTVNVFILSAINYLTFVFP